MKSKKRKTTLSRTKFQKEFKKQLRYGISAALGFIVAYSWREPFLHFFNNVVVNFTEKTITYQTDIITALIITLFGVLGIMAVAKFLK